MLLAPKCSFGSERYNREFIAALAMGKRHRLLVHTLGVCGENNEPSRLHHLQPASAVRVPIDGKGGEPDGFPEEPQDSPSEEQIAMALITIGQARKNGTVLWVRPSSVSNSKLVLKRLQRTKVACD